MRASFIVSFTIISTIYMLSCALNSHNRLAVPTEVLPVISGDYVNIYVPKGDAFPGPDTDELEAGRWYQEWVPNDHCFIKGPKGYWHAFGITHPLTSFEQVHDGEFQSFHARSSEKSFKRSQNENSWEDLPKVLITSQRPGEPIANHAPYIIEKDDVFYMFYGPTPIRYATSTNLYEWTPQGVLHNAPIGRDPSVFKWKDKYYMLTCGEGQVSLSSSTDMLHWDEHIVVLKMEEGVDPESPSIIQYNGQFYLFVCGWNGVWDKRELVGAYQHVTYVYQADTPFSFKKEVTQIEAHAPEIFQDENGNWYISSAEWPFRGVSVAPLDWVRK